MKTKATLILLILFNNCFSQINSDYKIYSVIIEDYFLQLDSAKKYADKAVIVDRLETETNWVSESFDYIDYAIFENAIDTLTKNKSKQMLSLLKVLYSNNPLMIIDSFQSAIPLILIKNHDFKKVFTKKVQKGWDKFYKMYPRAIGVFGFTKVIYSGDLAILFINFNRNGLFASGDVYIMKKINDKWIIFNMFNMYKA
jgi:hypothetical protein